jgi:hypothetical protein
LQKKTHQLELNKQFSYPIFMLKRFSHFFAWFLLVLMPLQGVAAANMSVCNSMMQAQMSEHQSVKKPCHMKSMQMASMNKMQDSCAHKNTGKSTCKTACATLCASLSGMTALNQTAPIMPVLAATQTIAAHNETYTSYSPPNLQRPPILLS